MAVARLDASVGLLLIGDLAHGRIQGQQRMRQGSGAVQEVGVPGIEVDIGCQLQGLSDVHLEQSWDLAGRRKGGQSLRTGQAPPFEHGGQGIAELLGRDLRCDDLDLET